MSQRDQDRGGVSPRERFKRAVDNIFGPRHDDRIARQIASGDLPPDAPRRVEVKSGPSAGLKLATQLAAAATSLTDRARSLRKGQPATTEQMQQAGDTQLQRTTEIPSTVTDTTVEASPIAVAKPSRRERIFQATQSKAKNVAAASVGFLGKVMAAAKAGYSDWRTGEPLESTKETSAFQGTELTASGIKEKGEMPPVPPLAKIAQAAATGNPQEQGKEEGTWFSKTWLGKILGEAGNRGHAGGWKALYALGASAGLGTKKIVGGVAKVALGLSLGGGSLAYHVGRRLVGGKPGQEASPAMAGGQAQAAATPHTNEQPRRAIFRTLSMDAMDSITANGATVEAKGARTQPMAPVAPVPVTRTLVSADSGRAVPSSGAMVAAPPPPPSSSGGATPASGVRPIEAPSRV